MEELGKKIAAAREAKGLSIQDVAKATLLPTSIIKDIEAGNFENFKGDEQYVKMYLKKIAKYLDVDVSEIQDDYFAITQKYTVADLNEEANIKKPTGNTTVIRKIEDTIKSMEFTSPRKTEKKVYRDNYVQKYLKYAIVGVLVIAIIFVIWYAVSVSTSSKSSFTDSTTSSQVEGDVSSNDSSDTSTTTDSSATSDDSSSTADTTDTTDTATDTPAATITKNSTMNYNFTITDQSATTFTFTMNFVAATWASLEVNGSSYSGFTAGVYNQTNTSNDLTATPQTVTLTFNVADFQNLDLRIGFNEGHTFYINGVQVPLDSSDYSNGAADLILTKV